MADTYDGEEKRQGESRRKADNGWHLDKRVPVAIVFSIVIQTVAVVWWASDINTRVGRLEENKNLPERLGRIEESMVWMRQAIERIDRKLQ